MTEDLLLLSDITKSLPAKKTQPEVGVLLVTSGFTIILPVAKITARPSQTGDAGGPLPDRDGRTARKDQGSLG